MSRLNSITFDSARHDYVVQGVPLLEHLAKHEQVDPKRHIPAPLSQPGACQRLLGAAPPDLVDGQVALYVCSHCGGYDGSPIGVQVEVTEDRVAWSHLGWSSDYDPAACVPFRKVRGYTFARDEYLRFIDELRLYQPS